MSSAWWCRFFAIAAISSSCSSYSSTRFWCLSFYINNNSLSSTKSTDSVAVDWLVTLWSTDSSLRHGATSKIKIIKCISQLSAFVLR
jgi:hypothetical protein